MRAIIRASLEEVGRQVASSSAVERLASLVPREFEDEYKSATIRLESAQVDRAISRESARDENIVKGYLTFEAVSMANEREPDRIARLVSADPTLLVNAVLGGRVSPAGYVTALGRGSLVLSPLLFPRAR